MLKPILFFAFQRLINVHQTLAKIKEPALSSTTISSATALKDTKEKFAKVMQQVDGRQNQMDECKIKKILLHPETKQTTKQNKQTLLMKGVVETLCPRLDLTLSPPRVIYFKFPLQPHQKYNITQYEELSFS